MVAPSRELVGDKVQREEAKQNEGARGRIEGIRQEFERDRESRNEPSLDKDSEPTHYIKGLYVLTEVNQKLQHELRVESEKKMIQKYDH